MTDERLEALLAPNQLVPFKEVCRTLSIGKTTLYGLINRGEIKSLKIGDKRVFPIDELRRLASGGPQAGDR